MRVLPGALGGLDWYWPVPYLLEGLPEFFLAFFPDSADVSSGEFHVQGFVLVLVEVDQGICLFPGFMCFSPLPFSWSVWGLCGVPPCFFFLFLFVYIFCFGVCAVGLCVPRDYIGLYGGFGVLRGCFLGFVWVSPVCSLVSP